MNPMLISIKDVVYDFLFNVSDVDCLEKERCADTEKSLDLELVKIFFRTALIWLGIYMLSYYDFSISWLLIPLFFVLIHQKEELRRKRKNGITLSLTKEAANKNEKNMIESHFDVDELPSWVVFPDKERAEWINSFTQQLWPNVDKYVKAAIVPKVQGVLENVGINCDRIVLGRVPPRITGVKMYDKNTDRNEIIMDVDIIYASDCDAKFSYAVQSKNVVCMTVKEFSLMGCLRIVLTPLVEELPFIGNVQVCFLRSPEVDFVIGGEAKVLNTFGLTKIIRNVIIEKIDSIMVMPNRISLPLARKNGESKSFRNKDFKCPFPSGVLKVQVHMAAELERKDFGKMIGKGKSDPYAIISVGSQKLKSNVINDTDCPKWDNLTANFLVEVGQDLLIEFFDEDPDGDDQLGQLVIPIDPVASKGNIDKLWVDLDNAKSGKALISLMWNNVSDGQNAELKNDSISNKCILQVFIDSCSDLVERSKKPSPFVSINVGRRQEKRTKAQWHTTDPIFEEGFAFLVNNLYTEFLHVKVLDSNESENGQEDLNLRLGEVDIPIYKILQHNTTDSSKLQPYALKACSGNIILYGKVTCLKESNLGDEMDLYSDSQPQTSILNMPLYSQSKVQNNAEISPNQSTYEPKEVVNGEIKLSISSNEGKEVNVIVHEAKNLRSDGIHSPNPFVRLHIVKEKTYMKRKKTKAKKGTQNPTFDKKIKFILPPNEELEGVLKILVIDKKGIMDKDVVLGELEINLQETQNKDITEEWFELQMPQEN